MVPATVTRCSVSTMSAMASSMISVIGISISRTLLPVSIIWVSQSYIPRVVVVKPMSIPIPVNVMTVVVIPRMPLPMTAISRVPQGFSSVAMPICNRLQLVSLRYTT